MLRLFLFSLAVATIGILVSLYTGFPADPGYIMLAFGNYSFETSLFALLVACFVAFMLLKLLQIVLEVVNPLRWIRAGRRFRRRRRSLRTRSTEGMLALMRGNYDSALSKLSKSKHDPQASVLDYLGLALAAYELGQRDRWLAALQEAEQEFPSARSTINALRAQLHYRSGQIEQSMAVLEQLRKTSVNDPVLLQTLKKVYLQLEDWTKLKQLLPVLVKRKLVSEAEADDLGRQILLESLQQLSRSSDANLADVLRQEWKAAPSAYRQHSATARTYAGVLLDQGFQEEAAKVIEFALSRSWNDELVRYYGSKDFGNPGRQLVIAENWLKDRPANGELLLALGRLSMRHSLWGKAREYYSASLKIAPTAEAFGELGRLYHALGEEQEAERCLGAFASRTGLLVNDLPLPQPAQPLIGQDERQRMKENFSDAKAGETEAGV